MSQAFKVMVRCPETRAVLDTGIRTSGREGLSNDAYREGVVGCSHCGRFHSLDEDAFLQPDRQQLSEPLWRPNP